VAYVTAAVYAQVGKTDQAISILEQLVKANPNWTQAKDLLNQLRK